VSVFPEVLWNHFRADDRKEQESAGKDSGKSEQMLEVLERPDPPPARFGARAWHTPVRLAVAAGLACYSNI
jgi:hypothetical protein